MGQTIGKVYVHPGAAPFVNLPTPLIDSLRKSVNEVAEGYGLRRAELKLILNLSLQEHIRKLGSTLDNCLEALFALFSTDAALVKSSSKDKNEELIDSFELLATIFILSGLQRDEKINYIFDLFDISESGNLTINEVNLAFRSLASGASKICSKSIEFDAHSIDIDTLVLKGFKVVKIETADEQVRMNRQDFFDFVLNCRAIVSFLTSFDDIEAEERTRSSIELVEQEVADASQLQPWKETLRLLTESIDEEPLSSLPSSKLKLNQNR